MICFDLTLGFTPQILTQAGPPCYFTAVFFRHLKTKPATANQNPGFRKKLGLWRGDKRMTALSLEKLYDYLGTRAIPGSERELHALCVRIGELVELNGEAWVKYNRQKLLDEWEYIVRHGIMS